jgi:hypothetical protein
MAFKYSAVTVKTDPSTQWFQNANPTSFNAIKAFFQAQPGFVSGSWTVNPDNASEFLTEHTWTNKAAWVAAATAALETTEMKQFLQHAVSAGEQVTKTFAEV